MDLVRQVTHLPLPRLQLQRHLGLGLSILYSALLKTFLRMLRVILIESRQKSTLYGVQCSQVKAMTRLLMILRLRSVSLILTISTTVFGGKKLMMELFQSCTLLMPEVMLRVLVLRQIPMQRLSVQRNRSSQTQADTAELSTYLVL